MPEVLKSMEGSPLGNKLIIWNVIARIEEWKLCVLTQFFARCDLWIETQIAGN